MRRKEIGHCCFCIPLQMGTSLICMVHFIFAIVCIVTLFINDMRFMPGGYNQHTAWIQVVVGVFGLGFALLGMLGAWDEKVSWIQAFKYFLFVKCAALLIVFLFDMLTLQKCEGWAFSMQSQTNYNGALDSISKKGLCEIARLSYCIGFSIDFGLNAYWTYIWYDFCRKVKMGPAYMIFFPDVNEDDHTQARKLDPHIGEPSQYIPALERPESTFGYGYSSKYDIDVEPAGFDYERHAKYGATEHH